MSEKTVLITGCSEGGIGAALAKAFHAKGYHVFATLRNPAKAGSLEPVTGIDISTLDVTEKKSIQQCVQYIETKTGGKLDVLVNNAGADCTMPLLDVSLEEAKALYDLNVWAVLALTQAFAPMLVKARGTVVNINSVAAKLILAWGGELPLLYSVAHSPCGWEQYKYLYLYKHNNLRSTTDESHRNLL